MLVSQKYLLGGRMPVEAHIERAGSAITLQEWNAVIAKYPNLRHHDGHISATNPNTGEVISLQLGSGSVEMLLGSSWVPAFRWHNGSVTFEPLDDEVISFAKRLAADLSANVVTDEGELLDPVGGVALLPEQHTDFPLSVFVHPSLPAAAVVVLLIVVGLAYRRRRTR
jgi:hypothetical protein